MEPIVNSETNPSETSSRPATVASFDGKIDGGDNNLSKTMKMKEKALEKEPTSNLCHGLSSKVMSVLNVSTNGSKLESNPSTKPSNNVQESIDNIKVEKKVYEPRVFACRICERTFPTPQGLGGHQNAHKNNRSLVRRVGGGLDGGGFRHFSYYPPSSILTPHSYSSNLGVKANSMIHKPSTSPYLWGSTSSLNRAGHRDGSSMNRFGFYGGWSTPSMLNPQRSIDGLRLGGYGVAGAGAGSGSSSWNVQENSGVFGRLGVSPTNNSARNNKPVTDDHLIKLDNKAFKNGLVDGSGLDLSLKL